MAKAKILVIDDDEGMTELLELLLSPAASTIMVANDGLEGIELAKKNNPDIIIMDLMMPGMNGYDACRKIREFSSVPILVLSALNTPDVVATALDAGADDFLAKPVSTQTLMARLNKLLRRTPLSTTLLSVAGLV